MISSILAGKFLIETQNDQEITYQYTLVSNELCSRFETFELRVLKSKVERTGSKLPYTLLESDC